jgi:transcriptional regulator GlxA family with amidase domain
VTAGTRVDPFVGAGRRRAGDRPVVNEPRAPHQHTQRTSIPHRRALQSPPTFARRFRQRTGTTPLQLLRQRILAAQHLLETGGLPVDFVAQRCGFGSAATFRSHFRRQMGTTPLAYRVAFRRAA